MAYQLLDGIAPVNMAGYQVYTLEETGSTNTDALALAKEGAPDGLVLYAKKQTQGRGRMDRVWESKPNQSLAFTVLLKPTKNEQQDLLRFTALAALSLLSVFEQDYGLKGQVKWPNDVLLGGAKVCGILTETLWQGEAAKAVIVGVGVNLGREAYQSNQVLRYKATSLEEHCGKLVSPVRLLEALLTCLAEKRPQMGSTQFILDWNEKLAFKGEKVQLANEKGETKWFRLIGIQNNGALMVEDEYGALRQLYSSEISPSS